MAACGCGGAKKAVEEVEEKKVEKQENYDDVMAPAVRMDAIKVIFMGADLDGDKILTLDEWLECSKKQADMAKTKYDEAKAKQEFKDIDKSGNGKVSLAELDLYIFEQQLKEVNKKFKAADKSGDRKLDEKEFTKFFKKEGMKKKAIKKLWKRCDNNNDGNVSFLEFKEQMEREVADGTLKEMFQEMFNEDAKANEKAIRDMGAANQKKKDEKNAAATKAAKAEAAAKEE